jgi:hypothetical protein
MKAAAKAAAEKMDQKVNAAFQTDTASKLMGRSPYEQGSSATLTQRALGTGPTAAAPETIELDEVAVDPERAAKLRRGQQLHNAIAAMQNLSEKLNKKTSPVVHQIPVAKQLVETSGYQAPATPAEEKLQQNTEDYDNLKYVQNKLELADERERLKAALRSGN